MTSELSLAQTMHALTLMENTARASRKAAVALAMHPRQWARVVNETLWQLQLPTVPDSMRCSQPGTLGQIHGMIVLPMASPGVALFSQ